MRLQSTVKTFLGDSLFEKRIEILHQKWIVCAVCGPRVDHVWTTSPPSVFLVGVRMRVCVCTGREPGVSWGAKQWFEKKRRNPAGPARRAIPSTRPYISSIVYTGWHWWPSTPSAFMDWPWHCKQSIYSGSHWKICLSLSDSFLVYFPFIGQARKCLGSLGQSLATTVILSQFFHELAIPARL